jgi:hypothetical protein
VNPAAWVFAEVRRAVEGKVYPTLEDQAQAVTAFLEKLEADPNRVRALTYWSWIASALTEPLTENAA